MKRPVTTLLLAGAVPVFAHAAQAYVATPAANPPRSTETATLSSIRAVGDDVILCDAPTTAEWTLHSSNDGTHPNGDEQLAIWLMNRARQNPTGEGVWLATSDEPDIADGRDFYGVDTALLKKEFSEIAAKPPAAPDCRLFEAAVSQSNQLILDDAENHDGQFARIASSGFSYTHARGNVFSDAKSPLNAHAAFNIDWANDPAEDPDDGMLDGRGHRKAVMSIDGAYTNVGLALVPAETTEIVGPLVVTGNYAHADSNYIDHFNIFITGTVWEDDTGYDRNDLYDPGEGIPGVTVEIIVGTSGTGYTSAVTAAGGGYAIPVTDGLYALKFSGQGLTPYEKIVEVADAKSVLLDYKAFRKSSCTNDPDSIEDPNGVVINGDTYLAGSETVICSDVSITVNGATIKGPDGTVNGAALGLNSPEIHITSTAEQEFKVENGAKFYTTSGNGG